jgi:hypothetical protein|tara:strand:+ start:315 stop:743 length:429 start_codon:yes stop_codon:yes gene_type:complete
MGNKSGIDINVHQMERNHDERKARGFSRSVRGKYILSQALSIAIKYLKGLEERDDPYPKYGTHAEPSNREDMQYLFKELYPMYGVNPKSFQSLEQTMRAKGDISVDWSKDYEPTTADEFNLDTEKPDDEPDYYDENNEEYVK